MPTARWSPATARGLDVRYLRKQARAHGLFVRTRRTAPLDDAAKAAAAVTAMILKYGTPAERLGRGPAFRLRRTA